jgi:hypothetical protein
MSTSLALLINWFLIVGFALAAIAYFLFSRSVHRSQVVPRELGPANDRARWLKSQAGRAMEYIGTIFVVAVLAALSWYWLGVYRATMAYDKSSDGFARRAITTQQGVTAIVPRLLFTAVDDATTSGTSASVGHTVIVRLKLEDALMKMRDRQGRPTGCDRSWLHGLVRSAQVRVDSVDLTIAPNPAVDDTNSCYVSWSWLALPKHGGIAVALGNVAMILPGVGLVHASRKIPLSVGSPVTGPPIELTSVIVGLLSLVGVIFTTLMNRRSETPALK